MRDFLRRVADAIGFLWTLGFVAAGAIIGAATGYTSGGWIGAVALTFCGIVIGALASWAVRS